MNIKLIALGFSLFLTLISSAQEANAPKFGKGLFNLVGKDSSWTMKIGARMQLLATANWREDVEGKFATADQNFLIRRARLKFDGFAYSPKLKYKIELGLSNQDISGASEFTANAPRYILDAVVMWNFYGNFELWFGQAKLPGNIERVISSGNLQMVDRSLLNGIFNIDREMGVQLRHKFWISDTFLVREKLAISKGEGRNVTANNLGGHQYTARLEILPLGTFTGNSAYIGSDFKREPTPKLMLAATYDSNVNAVKTRSNQGVYMRNDMGFYETTINTLFIDGMLKYNGLSIMGEYAHRTSSNPIARNSDGTPTGAVVQIGDGFNLQTGYLFINNWEVSARYTYIKLDETITQIPPQTEYALGLSKFIVGHKLKVQADASYLRTANRNDQLIFRLQVDVHF